MWFTSEYSRATPDKKQLLSPHVANKKIELIEHLSIKRHTVEKMQPLQHNWTFPIRSRISLESKRCKHLIIFDRYSNLREIILEMIHSFSFIHSFECIRWKRQTIWAFTSESNSDLHHNLSVNIRRFSLQHLFIFCKLIQTSTSFVHFA